MTPISEIDAIKSVDEALSGLEDAAARGRVLRWAWEKFSTVAIPTDTQEKETDRRSAQSPKRESSGIGTTRKVKASPSLSIVKDLNLKPSGKKSLDELSSEKKPTSNQHKCALSVYYLKNELGLPTVSTDHVYTCFKHMKWRVPSDLRNTLQYTASQDGWLDTKNMADIKMTAIGDNVVEHDLPINGNK